MAVKPMLLLLLLIVATVVLIPVSHCRAHTKTQTVVLDISACVELTNSVLSLNSDSVIIPPQFQQSLTHNSHISLPLQPRHSHHSSSSSNHTYRALLLSRLARDSARVISLNTKLQLQLQHISKSDLEPSLLDTANPSLMDLSTPVVSGTSEGSGEYFTRIGVGTPATQYSMVIDTGSDVNWLQCQPCSDCYHQSDPIFDPSKSSSFSSLSCDSQQCSALDTSGCRSSSCLYQVSYGDGSYTVGNLITETVTLGRGAVNRVALGCGHDNEGLFVGAAGLVALGGGDLSLTRQLRASSFSYCLVHRDSAESSTLEFNAAIPSDSVLAPILRNQKVSTFYYVQMEGIDVGGQPVAAASAAEFAIDAGGRGGIIVDSGTAVTRLRTGIYESLRDSFRAMTGDLPSTVGVSLFDTCYDLSSRTSVRVPTVSFRMSGGQLWKLPASNYLIPVDNAGTFCFAFAPTSSSLSIIGNIQQQGTRVSYDLATNRVGFSQNKC